jgi:hypothetical protein
VDVVIAVDRSESMDVFLAEVIAALPTLLAGLADGGMDVQLAAVVDDDGCVNGELPWIDGSYSSDDAEAALEDMVVHHGGSVLSERAFLLLQEALNEDKVGAGGCNEGLLRTGAALHLLGISDEDEQSPGAWGDHMATLQALGADSGSVVFHAVSGDDEGCGVAAFEGFEDAVDATGGSLVSLCTDDWSGELDAMAATMAEVSGDPQTEGPYVLSQQPVAASISVRVDDTTVSEGWSWTEEGNSLTFEAVYAPSPGSVVGIDYAVLPEACTQQ